MLHNVNLMVQQEGSAIAIQADDLNQAIAARVADILLPQIQAMVTDAATTVVAELKTLSTEVDQMERRSKRKEPTT